MMRRFRRTLRKHSGITARRVAVRSQPPWYGRALLAVLLLLAGYALGYWQYGATPDVLSREQLASENRVLRQSMVHLEQRSQVDQAAQRNLAAQIAALQQEGMRLKEDVAFYEGILQESGTSSEPRIHSVRLMRAGHAGEYRYEILLTQSGRHDKPVQGVLRLELQGRRDGGPVSQPVAGLAQGGKVSFKYYQRVDGAFRLPEGWSAQSLLVELATAGARQQKLVKSVNFPV